MTVQALPSAIYHCNLPIKSVSAVYGSSINGRKKPSNSAPIPAWPDIEELDQWCCLPAYRRAIFMPKQSLDFMRTTTDEELLRDLDASICPISQAMAQYPGREKDTFSFFHEIYHFLVGSFGVYSAFRQSTQSDIIHSILQTIATAPQFTPHELRQLWNEFYAANRKLVELVQKFEIHEETHANFDALSSMPPEVADAVSDELWQAVGTGYREVYNVLSMSMHELVKRRGINPELVADVAMGVMEVVTALGDLNLLHDIYKLDPASVVDPASAVSMEFPRTSPKILYWRIFARVTMKQAMVKKAM
jgi:hypothetical protein